MALYPDIYVSKDCDGYNELFPCPPQIGQKHFGLSSTCWNKSIAESVNNIFGMTSLASVTDIMNSTLRNHLF